MLITELQQEQNRLRLILQHHLLELNAPDNPSGILIIQKHDKNFRWQKRDILDGIPVSADLHKKEKSYAGKLAVNLYRLVCIRYLQNQISIMDSVVRKYYSEARIKKPIIKRTSEEPIQKFTSAELQMDGILFRLRNVPRSPAEFLEPGSPYRPFILSFLENNYEDMIDWYLGDFVRNTDHPDFLQFPVKLGYKVRSKSEVKIADRLYEEGILFHYEERVRLLSGETVFPDFLVPLTIDEKYAWEHFGAMDSEKYLNRTRGKILDYMDSQWFPGINIIATYETRKNPLTEEQVDQKIRGRKNIGFVNIDD